ncbi:PREDICTED: protocadherin alpha-3-like isoform X2 [Nanorana parkeri]|uniref:protocadherin alpha-3-like isoform X2 n=1 Tax=Nanorana parkeri TaxID=125878 RepID=UPI00085482EA|nr:PREDICTED: protocadherin alpha-3-like isoform X2 [Nanorana parkeri]
MFSLKQGYQPWNNLVNFLLVHISWDVVFCQLHYIIPEESKHGTFVGRIAQDLRLDLGEINSRMLRVVSRDEKEYFQVNLQNGILFVKETIDRELICQNTPICIIPLQVIIDKPVQMYRVDVEIEDINDNSPSFFSSLNHLLISELRPVGSRFPIEGAVDPDLGTNYITNYELSASDYFFLDFQKYMNQIRSLEIVLKKSLDREEQSVHNLTLTAFDGGKPRLSGTTQIVITVEDVNDNAPSFTQPFYQCSVPENAHKGTLVIKLNATDLDVGKNAEILYEFSKMVKEDVRNSFNLDKHTGEIRVKGNVDFETTSMYEIQIDATDNGEHPIVGHCKVLVTVVDVNDNPPEMMVTSLSVPVPEDSPQGTTVAIISVHDKDSGSNGKVSCYLLEHTPFKIYPAFTGDFSLTVNGQLDYEKKSHYEVLITAKDEGFPPLSVSQIVKIDISDVNDNVPQFQWPVDTIFIKENNPPGSHVYTASASDPDIGQNSFITYSVSGSTVDGIPISSYISINPENGKVFALVSFDHEQVTYFQCHIKATDAGLSPLSSNLTLNVFIEDINDNAPTFAPLYSAITLKTPKSAKSGYLVGKVKAVDLDSGYNALISYNFKDRLEKAPFAISYETGEINLKRPFTDSDYEEYNLLVVAQDNGEPIMTAVTQIVITLVDPGEELKFEKDEYKNRNDEFSDTNVYLVIAICIISSIFLITLIAFTVLRWQTYRDEVNDLKESYKVCSNTGGSWMYSQHTQYRVQSTNSVQAKNDLIVFTPNNLQTPSNEELSNPQGAIINSSYKPKHPNPDWRYSASLKAAMQGAVHMEGAAVLRGAAVGLEQQWPTVSSATPVPEGGEVSPPVGAGVNCNSWTFKYGPGNQKQQVPQIPPDFPENFIIPGSPAIISIRQDQPSAQAHKSNFITFGKKEETKKKKKKKKGNKNQEKANNNAADNNDQ